MRCNAISMGIFRRCVVDAFLSWNSRVFSNHSIVGTLLYSVYPHPSLISIFYQKNKPQRHNESFAFFTRRGSSIMMSREIGNVLVFVTNKDERGAWLPTVDSIHYPGTAAFSYIINRSWGMVEILLIAHGCIVLMDSNRNV